jgi:hypothetical protein
MKAMIKVLYLAYSPILVVLYWRNTMRTLEDVHTFEVNFAE